MYYTCVYIYIWYPPPKKSPPFSLYNLILGNQRGVPYIYIYVYYIYIYIYIYACAQLNVYSVFMFVCTKVQMYLCLFVNIYIYISANGSAILECSCLHQTKPKKKLDR